MILLGCQHTKVPMGHQFSQGNASKKIMNSRGLSTEPWWTPTCTLTHNCTSCLSSHDFLHFDTLSEMHAQSTLVCLLSLKPTIGPSWAPCQKPFLDQEMQSKDHDSFQCIFPKFYLKMKMAAVVPRPDINPKCMSLTFTTSRMIISIICSTTFNAYSVSFRL